MGLLGPLLGGNFSFTPDHFSNISFDNDPKKRRRENKIITYNIT